MRIKKYEKISSYRLNKLINTFGGLDVCNFCPVKKNVRDIVFLNMAKGNVIRE